MSANKRKWAERIFQYLSSRYPQRDFPLHFTSAWELLVATQLSAQCTDARVNMVTPEFFKRWPDPQTLTGASVEELESVIHSTGFYRNKARNLLSCAKMLMEKHDGQVPANMEELLKLPGVARKTANVVLYGAFGVNMGLAVDTHVKRISHRLGLTDSQDPVEIEKDLMETFPQNDWGRINHLMVFFGRDMCKSRQPLCGQCGLSDQCPKNEPIKSTKKQGKP